MSNTLITPTIIAKEASMILKNNLVLGNKCYGAFSSEFVSGRGESVKVRVPMSPNVRDFSGTATATDVTESQKTITLSKHKYDQFSLSSNDLSLNLNDFSRQIVQPVMIGFAEQIESDIANLYKKIPYYSGSAGTTPTGVSDVTAVKKLLSQNKAPGRKHLVMDEVAEEKMLQLAAFYTTSTTGTNGTIVEGELGRKLGFDMAMSQVIKDHTKGTLAAGTAIQLNAGASAGATALVLKDSGGTLTGTLVEGDVITIAGNTQRYVVTADATASSNLISVSISPVLAANATTGAVVTLLGSHTANLAFTENALILASARLVPLEGKQTAYQEYAGISIRITLDSSSSTLSNIITFDCVYEPTIIQPELAARWLG